VSIPPTRRKSVFQLVADLPHLVIELVKEELAHLKDELVDKLKHAGIGIGLFAVAGVFLFFMLMVLVAAAVLGFATFLPGWLAALIVAGILLVLIVILVLIGVAQLKKGKPVPTETIDSVKRDVNAIKGIGKRQEP
jgi:predicted phage tail protein